MKIAKVYGGREVTVGDKVVYPGRQGSTLYLREGIVADIQSQKDWKDEDQIVLKVRIKSQRYKMVNGEYQSVDTTLLSTIYVLENVIPLR